MQVAGIANDNIPENKQRRKDTTDLNDEHDRIARNLPGASFLIASLMARFTMGVSKRGLFVFSACPPRITF